MARKFLFDALELDFEQEVEFQGERYHKATRIKGSMGTISTVSRRGTPVQYALVRWVDEADGVAEAGDVEIYGVAEGERSARVLYRPNNDEIFIVIPKTKKPVEAFERALGLGIEMGGNAVIFFRSVGMVFAQRYPAPAPARRIGVLGL